MSRGWAPDAFIDAKSAGWLASTGLFESLRAVDLRRLTRGELWKRWIEQGCRFPEGSTIEAGFSVYCRLKRLIASREASHPLAILKRLAVVLGAERATRANVTRFIGSSMVEEITAIQFAQGLTPRKNRRKLRRGSLKELLQVLPATRQKSVTIVFNKAAVRGAPIADLHIGRVLNLQPQLQPLGALVLLDCSWKKKSPATFQSYLGGLEKVDDFLVSVPTMRLHRLLDRLDGKVEELDEKTLVGLRTFALAVGATRTFVIQQFGSRLAVRLFLHLSDPLSFARITKSASKVISARDDRKGREREEQVLIDLHQNSRMNRLVRQRQAFVELAFNRYLEVLKQAKGRVPAGGLSLIVRTPVFDADGWSIDGAEQRVVFRIDTAGNVVRRAVARDKPGPLHHTMAKAIVGLDARTPSKTSDLREDLVVLYEGCEAIEDGGPTAEPFFIDILRSGVLEGATRHPPQVQAYRQQLLAKVAPASEWQPIPDLLCLPRSIRWVARIARGADPWSGEVVVPLVALHHGFLLGTACHEIVREVCPRTYEILQVQLGPDFIKKKLPGNTDRYPIMMRPKQHAVLKPYHVSGFVLKMIARSVKMANRRWFPENLGNAHKLPMRPAGLRANKPLPDGQYVFSNATATLSGDELNILRHVMLWDASLSKIQDGRFKKATGFGLAGEPDAAKAKLLKQRPGSRQPRHYDRSDGLLAKSGAHSHGNRKDMK